MRDEVFEPTTKLNQSLNLFHPSSLIPHPFFMVLARWLRLLPRL
jgi:hypothetical protein